MSARHFGAFCCFHSLFYPQIFQTVTNSVCPRRMRHNYFMLAEEAELVQVQRCRADPPSSRAQAGADPLSQYSQMPSACRHLHIHVHTLKGSTQPPGSTISPAEAGTSLVRLVTTSSEIFVLVLRDTHTHGHPQPPGPFPLVQLHAEQQPHWVTHPPTRLCLFQLLHHDTHRLPDPCPAPAAGPSHLIFSHHLPDSYSYYQKHSNCTPLKTLTVLPIQHSLYCRNRSPAAHRGWILTPEGSSGSSS